MFCLNCVFFKLLRPKARKYLLNRRASEIFLRSIYFMLYFTILYVYEEKKHDNKFKLYGYEFII